MILKTKKLNYYIYSRDNLRFDFDDRIKNEIKEKLNDIEIIVLEEDIQAFGLTRDLFIKANIVIQSSEEFKERLNKRELRYSEHKHNNRFMFYNDIEKELRSILVGTSNFLLIRAISLNNQEDMYNPEFDFFYDCFYDFFCEKSLTLY